MRLKNWSAFIIRVTLKKDRIDIAENYQHNSYYMFSNFRILVYALLVCLINWPKSVCAQSINSVFVSWNKATFHSLKQQEALYVNTKEIDLINNRRDALKAFLEIDGVESINRNSIRYQFLNMLFSKHNPKKTILFILEANESGYVATIRNFVVYMDSSHDANVDKFEFVSGKWTLAGKSKLNDFSIQNKLHDDITNFGRGFNNDDIIITKFGGNNIVECEYYLVSTLSRKSRFNNLINNYKGENSAK